MAGFANAVEAGKAFVAFGVQDRTAVGLRRISAKMRQFGAGLQVAGAQLFAGGLIAAAPLAMAFKAFNDLDESLQFLKAITQEVDGSFGKLRGTILTLGRTTSFTAKEVAEGAIALGRAGFSQGEITKSLRGVLDLARATRTELAVSADIAAIAMRSFKLESADMTMIVDTLTAASNSSAQTLEDFAEGFKLAAPMANNLGGNIKQLSIDLAVLADSGVKGSIAGTGLRRAFINMGKASNQGRITKYIGDIRDGNREMKPTIQLLAQLEDKIKSLDSVARAGVYSELFGRGANAMLVLSNSLIEGTSASDEFTNAYDEQADAVLNGKSASDTAAEAMESLWGKVKLLTSAFEGLKVAIIESIGDELERSVKSITTMIGGLIRFVKANKEVVMTWIKVTAAMLAASAVLLPLGAMFIVAGTAIGMVVNGIMALISVVGFAVSVVSTLAGVLGTVITGVVGVVAAIAGFVPVIIGAGFYVAGFISAFAIAEVIGFFTGMIAGSWAMWDAIKRVFNDIIMIVYDVGEAFMAAAMGIIRPFTQAFTEIFEAWDRSANMIMDLLAAGEIEAALGILVGELTFIFQNFWTNIVAGWETFIAALWYPFAAFGERLYDMWIDLKNFVLGILGEISNAADIITFGYLGTNDEFEPSEMDKISASTNFAKEALDDPRKRADAEIAERRRVWMAEGQAIIDQAAERTRLRKLDEEAEKQKIKDEAKAQEAANAIKEKADRGSAEALNEYETRLKKEQAAKDKAIKLEGLAIKKDELLAKQAENAEEDARIGALTAAPSGADIRTASGFQAFIPMANKVRMSIDGVTKAVREEMREQRKLTHDLLKVENQILKAQQEEDEDSTVWDSGDASNDPNLF